MIWLYHTSVYAKLSHAISDSLIIACVFVLLIFPQYAWISWFTAKKIFLYNNKKIKIRLRGFRHSVVWKWHIISVNMSLIQLKKDFMITVLRKMKELLSEQERLLALHSLCFITNVNQIRFLQGRIERSWMNTGHPCTSEIKYSKRLGLGLDFYLKWFFIQIYELKL